MPKPIAVCLEELREGEGRFLRCVAVPGRGPGLRLASDGAVRWRDGDAGCALCVSADDRLVLIRPAGGPPAVVSRAGRSVEAPEEKPVVLLGGDEIRVGGRSFRIHLHGPAVAVAAPEPLPLRVERGRLRAAATVVALGAAVAAGCGGGTPAGTTTPEEPSDASVEPQEPDAGEPIEIRYTPPVVEPRYPPFEPPDEPQGPASE